jgi:hypothetical protein
LLAAACSRGQNREEVIAELTKNGTMTEEQAICAVDQIESKLGIQTEDIVNDSDLSEEQRSEMTSIVSNCLLGTSGDDAATPTTVAPDTTKAPATTAPGATGLAGPAFDPDGDPVAQLNASDPAPGTDAELDALWSKCAAEDAEACDDLFWTAPVDSAYEAFGLTCGGREITDCNTLFGGTSGTSAPGLDPALDVYWDQCTNGSASACDQLFLAADGPDEYYDYGLFCGDREADFCSSVLGDDGPPPILASWGPTDPAPGTDPAMDALWAACANENGQACFDLYQGSELASAYERFGFTCGGRAVADCGLLFGGASTNDGDVDFGFTPQSPAPGTDAVLDALWNSCAAGDGQACDDLFFDSDIDSDYEQFGFTCGGREVTDCLTLLS